MMTAVTTELPALSDRELQVFRLLGEGRGATAIARELGVSIKTIETHQQRIKDKLHIATGAELHRQAERWLGQQVTGPRTIKVERGDRYFAGQAREMASPGPQSRVFQRSASQSWILAEPSEDEG